MIFAPLPEPLAQEVIAPPAARLPALLDYGFVGGLVGVRVFNANGYRVLARAGIHGEIVIEIERIGKTGGGRNHRPITAVE